ncbi:MAG: hypothetical protein AB1696_16130 [Planctomycetota bacterium]
MKRYLLSVCVMCLGLALSGSAADLPWEKLPFGMKPMIQEGSDNLVPAITKSLDGWEKQGDVASTEVEGKPAIRLGPKQGEDYALLAARIDAKPSTLYSISFKSRFTPDTEFNYDDSYPGLHGWVAIRGKGGTPSSWRIYEQRRGDAWQDYRVSCYTTHDGKQLDFRVQFKGVKGAALITDVDIREERIAVDQGRQVILPPDAAPGKQTRIEADLVDYAEAPRQPEPEAPAQVAAFHRPDPDRLFFYSRPAPDEINRPIALALCPGEVGVATLAVFAPKPLQKLRPIISMDEGFKGNVTWQVVQYHPRRVDFYGHGRTWHWVADFFLARPDGVNAEAGRTQVFWIKAEAGPNAKVGSYKGTISVQAGDQEVGRAALEISVRPFRLADVSDKVWGMYPDPGRWKNMTDEQVLRELDDFKAHAITCIHAPVRGEPVFDGDRITGWQFDETDRRLMGLVIKAKMPGPFLCWFGRLDPMLIQRLGLPKDTVFLPADKRPEKLTQTYKDGLVAFKKEFEKQGWGEPVFLGVDEPGYWKKGSPEQFLWEMRAATAAGWKTYCTSSYLPSDPIGQMLTYHCYGGSSLVNPERADLIRRETHAAGQKFWYYRTGAYSGEIGNVVRNRYYSGFMFFRSRADGCMSWTFQRPRGNAFDDFYANKVGHACVTYPDPEHPGENLDTPHWEGLRQGWIDYRYAATAAALAKQNPEAARELDAILNAMPWDGDVFMKPDVTNELCDEWREQIAALIEKYSQKEK